MVKRYVVSADGMRSPEVSKWVPYPTLVVLATDYDAILTRLDLVQEEWCSAAALTRTYQLRIQELEELTPSIPTTLDELLGKP